MIKVAWAFVVGWVKANPIKAVFVGLLVVVAAVLLCVGLWQWSLALFGGGASIPAKDAVRAVARDQQADKEIETLDQKTRRAVAEGDKQALREVVLDAIKLKEAAEKAKREAETKSDEQLKQQSLKGWD